MRVEIMLPLAFVIVALGFYHVGYRHAKIELKKDIAVAVAEQGAKDYEKLRKATDIQANLRDDIDRARADADRMRYALDAARAASASGKSSGTRIAGCERLLRESIELLSESREQLLKCAGKHDALATAVQ